LNSCQSKTVLRVKFCLRSTGAVQFCDSLLSGTAPGIISPNSFAALMAAMFLSAVVVRL
jgi:hypothetical protein